MSDAPNIERLAGNRDAVRQNIARAAGRAGRDPAGVTLVCVTKTVPAEVVRALHGLGERDFGENRVSVGHEKAEACAFPEITPNPLDPDARRRDGVRWHLIGHLQRNKAADALEHFRRVHSVESPKLVERLGRLAEARGIEVDVWLEANVAGEAAKYGVRPEALPELALALADWPGLRWRGLMTMAPFGDDPEASRPVFRRLAEWRKRLQDDFGRRLELSMGMSGDYAVAVEEGADLVRVGTALYL